MSSMGYFSIILVCIILNLTHVTAINFKLHRKETFCFHEIVHKGNKVLSFFDVSAWGYGTLVSMQVDSPSGHEIRRFESVSNGQVEFIASEDGEHSFCFRDANTDAEISFRINTEKDTHLNELAKGEHISELEFSAERLTSLVNAARVDIDEFKAREHVHRRNADKNRRRLIFWSVVECLLILGIAGLQIMRIRTFFEHKRMV